ncbi:sigma-70 family RNA polymerase sigma factor [Nocardia sp. NPDC004068]|uniref:sigma-70 family RNA polymerase sigma factor n=1 Tax=Nocardia sp. NPDC004068 TaxID=3364303 RepID=UPI0036A069A7
MHDTEFLAEAFERHRAHLRAVAARVLGSLSEADDAVQEAWLRLARTDTADIDNLGGWLTTVVGRICLDMLRSRKHEEPLDDDHLPDPVITPDTTPEHEALLADSVGLGLLMVLESLSPAERLAFVLHDMFALPYDRIAPIVDRTPQTARKLASQARRRVQGTVPSPDRPRQRRVVDAFLTAARDGDFAELLRVLDPDVVLRADAGQLTRVIQGAEPVATQALSFRPAAVRATSHRALVNGLPGLINIVDGTPVSIIAFTLTGDHITGIEILADPARLKDLDLTGVLT